MNWYLQSSENSDVIRSSRIRFVRNINGINFKLGLKDREILENKIKDDIVPTFHKYHYTADKYPFEYNRPGLENFKCINKLTINCWLWKLYSFLYAYHFVLRIYMHKQIIML